VISRNSSVFFLLACRALNRDPFGTDARRIPRDVNPLASPAADVRDLTIRAPVLSRAERSVGHRHMPG
jgi:hypothetical protein